VRRLGGTLFATHRLSRQDLRALVAGEDAEAAVDRLRAAELSKHKVLLAAIMRMAGRVGPADHARTLVEAYRLLVRVEAQDGSVVRDLLASPQFGVWAAHCLHRLSGRESDGRAGDDREDDALLSADLGQLAAFAASAAFRARLPFEIEVPLRDGAVAFPALGAARPGADTALAWGRVCQDARDARVSSPVSNVRVPASGDRQGTDGGWSGLPRFAMKCNGLRLNVVLDSCDPFLHRDGAARTELSEGDVRVWQGMLARAWSVLATDHHSLARVIAGTVRTVVPVRAPSPTRSASSTDTSAYGAMWLSLPPDALAMAEALVHESHHAVLGAAMDVQPMVADGQDFLTYAPWREDPRPVSALLQGIYTHYAMMRFWRRQWRCGGSPAQRLRSQVEFGRWRTPTAQAADVLAQSAVLTVAGGEFLSAIRAHLAGWQHEQLSDQAAGLVADLDTEHLVRWRLSHLVPDPAAIGSLAAAWRDSAPPAVPPTGIDVVLQPGPLPAATANARSYLLSLRHNDRASLRRLAAGERPEDDGGPGHGWIDQTDLLLTSDRYAEAAAGYLERIAADGDVRAWAGLAVACRHTGPPAVTRLLAERPEVAAALYGRLHDSGSRPEPGSVLTWLAAGP
jgi:HEXXH motif-containing protein